MDIDRKELVRRLLGAATQLFLDDADPLSIHCLASSAAEHSEYLAESTTGTSLAMHIRQTFPEMKGQDIKRVKNRFYNVIKHSHDRKGNPFNVAAELSNFDDSANDAILFSGWSDYMECGHPIPIAAHVFELWFLRIYPESLNPYKNFDFPALDSIEGLSRSEQKEILREEIRKAHELTDVIGDVRTDDRPLVLP